MAAKTEWYVYMVECADKTFYTGITTDVERRLAEHNGEVKGAKYTKARRPVRLAYQERAASRSEAAKGEVALRRNTHQQKRELCKKFPKE